MYGWRARIGHVAPSRGDTLVYEFYKMFPEGFMMLNTTGTVRQLVDSDFEAQLNRIEEATQDLVDNNCDSIIFSGSPLFTRLPFGADRELAKKLSDKFGVPVAAGLTAEVEALKAMNCQKLVVGTPMKMKSTNGSSTTSNNAASRFCRSPVTACARTLSSPTCRCTLRTRSPSGSTLKGATLTVSLSPARAGRLSPMSKYSKMKSASRSSPAAWRAAGTP